MSLSFYDVSVGTYLQVGASTQAFMAKAADHFQAEGMSLDDVVNARLREDMNNFHFQAVCVVHHSIGAIKGMQSGEFRPPSGYPDTDYAGLQQLVGDAVSELKALTPADVNALADGQLTFKIGDNALPFTNSNFLLSFSLPNFYFHATTAYDLLRSLGAPLGKMDFLGQLRVGI